MSLVYFVLRGLEIQVSLELAIGEVTTQAPGLLEPAPPQNSSVGPAPLSAWLPLAGPTGPATAPALPSPEVAELHPLPPGPHYGPTPSVEYPLVLHTAGQHTRRPDTWFPFFQRPEFRRVAIQARLRMQGSVGADGARNSTADAEALRNWARAAEI